MFRISWRIALQLLSLAGCFAISVCKLCGEQLGPFTAQPAFALYLVETGSESSARLLIEAGPNADNQRAILRILDADEKLTYWEYLGPENVRDPSLREGLLLDHTISFLGRGIHQVRLSSGTSKARISLEVANPTTYGVSFQNGIFSPWTGQSDVLYVYVPPHAEELTIAGGPVRIIDEKGREIVNLTTSDFGNTVTLPVSATSVVWRVEFPQVKNWQLRVAGFPFILCSDAAAALAIHASVEVLPDGTVVSHKFQRRIAEILPELLAPEKVGLANELVEGLSAQREEWLKEPERNSLLLSPWGIFPSVERALRSQNVDSTSHWGGSMDGWQSRIDKPVPENRWDRLKSVPGLWGGASEYNMMAENLAEAALLDAPFNPYFGKKELLNRAAASALLDLMTVGEDDVLRGVSADMSDYPGFMGFALGFKTLPLYALVAPHMPEKIRSVWTEGVRHLVDRSFPDDLVSCRNQSAHYLRAYQCFAEGSGDPVYGRLAKLYDQRFSDGASSAGYHMENFGPDASYIGLTHWYMAVTYRLNHDPVLLESLRKSYALFNHTVAPEPDGTMLGGFNFNHRIGDSFVSEQWQGARGILDDVLPEVGIWSRRLTGDALAKKTKEVSELLDKLPEPVKGPSDVMNPRYTFWNEPLAGTWPALEKEPFTRLLGKEFLAVKRQGYYAVIYVGKPVGAPSYIESREALRAPFPGNAESEGGEADSYNVTPFLGGGLSLFWTREYGSAVLAANWSPLTHHGLVATAVNGKRYWEDYFETRYRLDEDSSGLTVKGKLEGIALEYIRRYLFKDDELAVELTLIAIQDIELGRLHENIPLAYGSAKSGGVRIEASDEKEGKAIVSVLTISNDNHQGVEVVLDKPRPVTIQRNGLKSHEVQVARVEIELPHQLKAGEKIVLSYSLRPKIAGPSL